MINAKEVSLSFGAQTIFNNISFNLNQNQRVGLVGCNGSVKTTLLEVIAGNQGIDSGQINVQKGAKIAYMPQEVVLLSEKLILDSVNHIFGHPKNGTFMIAFPMSCSCLMFVSSVL